MFRLLFYYYYSFNFVQLTLDRRATNSDWNWSLSCYWYNVSAAQRSAVTLLASTFGYPKYNLAPSMGRRVCMLRTYWQPSDGGWRNCTVFGPAACKSNWDRCNGFHHVPLWTVFLAFVFWICACAGVYFQIRYSLNEAW